jgi:threonine/homoserine/homoserine lactone efflux protein
MNGSHDFKLALTAVAAGVGWVLLFLIHTRVVIPRIVEAQFPGSFILAVVVGLVGLAALAWIGWTAIRRLRDLYRQRK